MRSNTSTWEKCQGRISAWQSSLVELRPVNIYNINIKICSHPTPHVSQKMIKSYQIHKFHRKLRRTGGAMTTTTTQPRNHANNINTTTTLTSDVLIYIHSSSGIQTIFILPLNDSRVLVGYSNPTHPFSCGEHLCGKRVQRRSRQLCRTCSGIPG